MQCKFKLKIFVVHFFLSVTHTAAAADNQLTEHKTNQTFENDASQVTASAPMGVFGAESPESKRIIFKVMPVFSSYAGQLIGSRGVSSQNIVLTTPTFSNPKAFMRVVPQNVPVSLQSVIISYGLTDSFSAVISASIIQKQLYALTFLGETGGIPLGSSFTGTKGFSDLTTSAVYKLYQDETNKINVNLGLAYPLSSDTRNIQLLQPNATYSNERAFYSLQPGSRTLDFLPGAVYSGHSLLWSWGLSYRGRIPLANNPQGWRFGNSHEFSGWIGYNHIPSVTSTIRLSNTLQGAVNGYDPQISGGSVPTNPNFYGGHLMEVYGGFVIDGEIIQLNNISIQMESGVPVYQNLNGPQIRKNWQSGIALKVKM